MSKQDGLHFLFWGALAWGVSSLTWLGLTAGLPPLPALNAALGLAGLGLMAAAVHRSDQAPTRLRVHRAVAFCAPAVAGAALLGLAPGGAWPALAPDELGRYCAVLLAVTGAITCTGLPRRIRTA